MSYGQVLVRPVDAHEAAQLLVTPDAPRVIERGPSNGPLHEVLERYWAKVIGDAAEERLHPDPHARPSFGWEWRHDADHTAALVGLAVAPG